MPRYRLTQPSFIAPRPGLPAQLLPAGAEIDYPGIPGSALEPLDAEAQAAVQEHRQPPKGLLPVDGRRQKQPQRPDPSSIDIPDGWIDMRPEQVVNLARRLGASGKCRFAQAVTWIENELKRRNPQTEN